MNDKLKAWVEGRFNPDLTNLLRLLFAKSNLTYPEYFLPSPREERKSVLLGRGKTFLEALFVWKSFVSFVLLVSF